MADRAGRPDPRSDEPAVKRSRASLGRIGGLAKGEGPLGLDRLIHGRLRLGIVSALALAGVAAAGWERLPPALRRHARLALWINLPLFLLFCSPAEMRNLSMLYPTLTCLMALALDRWARERPPPTG